jgi:hypothetical protein
MLTSLYFQLKFTKINMYYNRAEFRYDFGIILNGISPGYISRPSCTQAVVFLLKRVPTGWKSAGAHFQQQLAHTVLSGLLYSECELYIDDILAFASSEEELLERLHRLFERFRTNAKSEKYNSS